MNDTVEKAIAYVLGGVVGAVIGLTILSFHLPMFEREGLSTVLVIITTIIGILTAIVIIEYRTEKTLKKNTAIRDETVALITHEMRTALTSTGWAIDMILKKYKETINSEDAAMLNDVVGSIHSTVMHSVNLLDVSLLDIGKLSISLEWVTLDKVELIFKEIIEKYALGAAKYGVELASSVKLDGSRKAEIDKLRLRIVLENLIENALQYIGTGEKKISIDISNDAKNMNMTVKDTGIGIPEKEKEKIFSEFYRASNARKIMGSGSGIGLYTCYTYVKAHRGDIRFESKEGEGSEFFITIPLNTAADVEGFLEKI